MKMIRHYHVFIEINIGPDLGRFPSLFLHDPPQNIQYHFAIYNLTEQIYPPVSANSYEVRP